MFNRLPMPLNVGCCLAKLKAVSSLLLRSVPRLSPCREHAWSTFEACFPMRPQQRVFEHFQTLKKINKH